MHALIIPLSQVTDVASAASHILSGRSDSMILLVLFMLGVGLWVWKVTIPERTRNLDIKGNQAEALKNQVATLERLSNCTIEAANDSYNARKNTETLIASKLTLLDCLEKVNDKFPCGIESNLAEARGMLRMSQVLRGSNEDERAA